MTGTSIQWGCGVQVPAGASWAFSAQRMQHFLGLLGAAFNLFAQVGWGPAA
jgi:hypothetical protein